VSRRNSASEPVKNKYGADLQIVGLHVGGEEDQERVPEFVERLKINYALAYPEDALSNALMGTDNAIPQTFVFDRGGRLTKKLSVSIISLKPI
jgi:hypothetical protein